MERKQTLDELKIDIWDVETRIGKTKFYLLNGRDERIYFVDEFPSGEYARSYELPTILTLFSGKSKQQQQHQVDLVKDNRYNIFENCREWKESQENGRFHEFKTGQWKKALGRLRFAAHESDFGCFKSKIVPIQSRKVAAVDKGKERDAQDAACEVSLEYLPVEVFEALVPYLDVFSFFNACKASPNLEVRLMEALGTDTLKRWKYWFNAASGLNRDFMLKVLASFDGVLERIKRAEANVQCAYYLDAEINDEFSSLFDFNFEEVCRSCYQLWDRLCYGTIQIKNMENMETAIKSFIQISSQERGAPISWDEPKSITQTCGPFLFNVLSPSPWNIHRSKNWRVMEDLDRCKIRRSDRIQHEEVRYVTVMYVPPSFSTTSPGPGIPGVFRIIIAVCKNSIILFPLPEGRSQKLSFPEFNETHWNLDPILAVNEDVFSTWQNPQTLNFYRCYLFEDERGSFVNAQLIQTVRIYDMLDHWQRIASFKHYYIPVLEKVKGSYEMASRDFQNIFTVEELDQDYYELQLISYRCGREVLGPRNAIHSRNNGVITHFVTHQFPQYYLQNAIDHRDSLEIPYTSAKGYGLFVFWNSVALAISWDGLTWIFETWKHILSLVMKGNTVPFKVSQVDIFSPDGIAIVLNRNVVLLHVGKTNGGQFISCGPDQYKVLEPRLSMTVVRVVVLCDCPNLEVNHMAVDYDKGLPYIFLTLKDENSENGLDFFATRVTFECGNTNNNEAQARDSVKKPLNNGTSFKEKTADPAPASTLDSVRAKSPVEYFAADPDLFNISSYPNVLEKVKMLQKALFERIPPGQLKSIRKRYKDESYHHYEEYLNTMRTSSPLLD